MEYERRASGLIVPRHRGEPCSLLMVNQLIGFGAGGGAVPDAPQPAWNPSDKNANITLSDSDRTFSLPGSKNGGVRSTAAINGVARYVEFVFGATGADIYFRFGLTTSGYNTGNSPGSNTGTSIGWVVRGDGRKLYNNSDSACLASLTAGDVVMLFTDGSAVWFGLNGSWNGDPSARTGAAFTGLSGDLYLVGGGSNNSANTKSGTLQVLSAFVYPAPLGAARGW